MADEEDINQEDLSSDNNFDPFDEGSEYITMDEDENPIIKEDEDSALSSADNNTSIKDILKTELVEAKFNKEFTSEIVLDNLSNSFIVLSNLLEDSNLAKENMEQLFAALDRLRIIVEAMKESADKMNDISQIVDQLNSLAVVISTNSTNVEKLIKIISESVSKNRELEKDLNSLKSSKFYAGDRSAGGSASSSLLDKSQTILQAIIIGLLGLLVYKG
jgi:phosphotransferase system IIB component